jgi:hypothetical protein
LTSVAGGWILQHRDRSRESTGVLPNLARCGVRPGGSRQDARLRSTLLAFHELLDQLAVPHEFTEVKGADHVFEDIVGGLGDEGLGF